MNHDDAALLRRAIELASHAMRTNRGGPFGAVVTLDGRVVGEGANSVLVTNDPTAHAEVVAIRAATAKIGAFSLRGATLYASSEPCPMCLAAIHWARIDRVLFANDRNVAARAGFDDTFFYEELARAPNERRVQMSHVPLTDAEILFEEWRSKSDKTPY